jgi:hypothetical protein
MHMKAAQPSSHAEPQRNRVAGADACWRVGQRAQSLRRVLPRLLLGLPLVSASVRGADEPDVVTVISATYPPYVRPALQDGSVNPQTYAFGEGGDWNGRTSDSTSDVNFPMIARLLAPELAKQGYTAVPSRDPKRADLLIMVYWGTTVGKGTPSSSSEYQIARQFFTHADQISLIPSEAVKDMNDVIANMGAQAMKDSERAQGLLMIGIANRNRDRLAGDNACLLGYVPELQRMAHYRRTPFSGWNDVAREVEESRYFVVLLAYDFQSLWRAKQKKLLWQTRLSISAHRADFREQLAGMLRTAAPYFGRDSGRLVREPMPAMSVRLGEMKVVETDVGTKK